VYFDFFIAVLPFQRTASGADSQAQNGSVIRGDVIVAGVLEDDAEIVFGGSMPRR
jgi:hypothetical protein